MLYGPLHFFASQNEELVKLHSQISNAYTKEYEKAWSEDDATQRSISEQTTKTIDFMNKYSQMLADNNDKMTDLLKENYHLIGAADLTLFEQHVVFGIRHKTEFANGGPRLPLRIHWQVGDVLTYRPEMTAGIKAQYDQKTSELAKWRRVSGWKGWILWRRKRD